MHDKRTLRWGGGIDRDGRQVEIKKQKRQGNEMKTKLESLD